MLKGIGVSEGYGIGRVLVIKEPSLEYTPHSVEDTDAEVQRFNEAVEAFCEDTTAQAETIRKNAGSKEAEILEGHIAIIRDPFMADEIANQIKAGQCAETCVEQVCQMFIDMFTATGDDVIMQRTADVRDVRDALLSILLGVNEVKLSDAPAGTVIVLKELTPSQTSGINRENIVGIIAETGSQTSHSAILARALEIPAVLSVPDAVSSLANGDLVIVDGGKGTIIIGPDEATQEEYSEKRETFLRERRELEQFRGRKTENADGREYELFCNIGTPKDAEKAVAADAEGVGLFRTEFLFMDRNEQPGEEEQFEAYKQASLILKGAPLIIRTLDIGGDKDIPYMDFPKEENPFMGFRAIRYCLKNKETFKAQLRAILRASAFGDIRIMFPMVTTVEEVREGRALVEESKAELEAEGIAYDKDIKVGIMTETASSGVIADLLAKESDFFSIGTNDLTGYTMAADRGNSEVSYLYSTYQPGVLRMIRRIIECGTKEGIPVGMCGEAAADPKMIPLLISFGLTEFSVSAPSVLKVRKIISEWTKEEADKVTAEVMSMSTEEEIRSYLETVV